MKYRGHPYSEQPSSDEYPVDRRSGTATDDPHWHQGAATACARMHRSYAPARGVRAAEGAEAVTHSGHLKARAPSQIARRNRNNMRRQENEPMIFFEAPRFARDGGWGGAGAGVRGQSFGVQEPQGLRSNVRLRAPRRRYTRVDQIRERRPSKTPHKVVGSARRPVDAARTSGADGGRCKRISLTGSSRAPAYIGELIAPRVCAPRVPRVCSRRLPRVSTPSVCAERVPRVCMLRVLAPTVPNAWHACAPH